MPEWVHGSGRKGDPKKVLRDKKEKCPRCGEQARRYEVSGEWERHRSYDYDANGKRKGNKYSWCKGK